MQQMSALARSLGSGRHFEMESTSKAEMLIKSAMHYVDRELHTLAGLPHHV